MPKRHKEKEMSEIFNDPNIITRAIQKAINAALLRHKKLGFPICAWKNGSIVWIKPKDIKIKKIK